MLWFWVIFFDVILLALGMAACAPMLEVDRILEETTEDEEAIVIL